MAVKVHENALKHGLTEEDVAYAWNSPIRCRRKKSKDEPPRWIAIGILPSGRMAELVAVEDIAGDWVVFHANVPPTQKFIRELELNGGKK